MPNLPPIQVEQWAKPQRLTTTQVAHWADKWNAAETLRTQEKRSLWEKLVWLLMVVGSWMAVLASSQC